MVSFFFSSRELLENAIAVKSRRMNSGDHEELAKLLIEKDQELKKTIEVQIKKK